MKGEEIRLSDYRKEKKNSALFLSQRLKLQVVRHKPATCATTIPTCVRPGYEVIGVSVDNEKSHQKFIEKNNLPFTLIADTDKKLVEQFGVWGEKSMYGRKYMGTFRTTFIINEEGVIERIITPKEVKTKDHAAQIL